MRTNLSHHAKRIVNGDHPGLHRRQGATRHRGDDGEGEPVNRRGAVSQPKQCQVMADQSRVEDDVTDLAMQFALRIGSIPTISPFDAQSGPSKELIALFIYSELATVL
jgi:hypothetical protein